MKKNIIIIVSILVVMTVFLIFVAWFTYNSGYKQGSVETINQIQEDDISITCREVDFTIESLQKIANEGGMNKDDINTIVDQEYVDQLNKRPFCKDFCADQLKYSQQYPDEWFAEDDLREYCRSFGIVLPD